MAIIRGTTPTIIFTFSQIRISDITVAYLVIKQSNKPLIEKDISEALIDETSISWKLTQEETLGLSANRESVIYCDWKLTDGTRGRSTVRTENTENSGKNEVI